MTTVGDMLYQMGGVPVNSEFTTGSIFFVHGGTGSNSHDGKSPDTPLATWDYAVGLCTANKNDIIYLMPGHAETVTSSVTLDVAGVKTIGIGHGDTMPKITVNAAINGVNVTAADNVVHNVYILAGSSVTAATRLIRVAADNFLASKCWLEMGYDMYHMVVILSGDNDVFDGCKMINAVTTAASVHPQTAILNIAGTNAQVKGCYFNDLDASKAERWRTCVEGGKLTADLVISDCTFVCRGVATATRSAGASGVQITAYCRGISPSSNTSVGSIFTPTYQLIVETYNVAAVNKVGVVTVTTSDLRMKKDVIYL